MCQYVNSYRLLFILHVSVQATRFYVCNLHYSAILSALTKCVVKHII
jgi:hypothetical protein